MKLLEVRRAEGLLTLRAQLDQPVEDAEHVLCDDMVQHGLPLFTRNVGKAPGAAGAVQQALRSEATVLQNAREHVMQEDVHRRSSGHWLHETIAGKLHRRDGLQKRPVRLGDEGEMAALPFSPTGAPQPLQKRADGGRRPDLHHQIEIADIQADSSVLVQTMQQVDASRNAVSASSRSACETDEWCTSVRTSACCGASFSRSVCARLSAKTSAFRPRTRRGATSSAGLRVHLDETGPLLRWRAHQPLWAPAAPLQPAEQGLRIAHRRRQTDALEVAPGPCSARRSNKAIR